MNARTSEDWFEKNGDHVVRGRVRWISAPLKIVARTPQLDAGLDLKNQTPAEGGGVHEYWGGGYGKGTVPPFVWVMPANKSVSVDMEAKEPKGVEVKVAVLTGLLLLASVAVALGFVARARKRRFGGATSSVRRLEVGRGERTEGEGMNGM